MNFVDKAVLRYKQALGDSSGGIGAPAAPAAPKVPTTAPKAPAAPAAPKAPAAPARSLMPQVPTGPNPALQRFSQMRANPTTPAAPVHIAPQSQQGAQVTQQMQQQFGMNPQGFMQAANRSGPLGGLLGAGSLIHSDSLKTIFGDDPTRSDIDTSGGGGWFTGMLGDIGRHGALGPTLGLLGKIPGVSSLVSRLPGAGRLGGLLGIGGRLAPAVSGALNVGWAPVQAIGDMAQGDFGAAGRRFYNDAYNRSMGDSRRSYTDRAWEAMHPENFYRNATGTGEALVSGDFWKGLGINMGLVNDNQG